MSRKRDHESRSGDLDPVLEPDRWEHLVNRIQARAAPRLAERRRGPNVLEVLAEWARPTLSAAAAVMLLVAGGLVYAGQDDSTPDANAATLAEAVVPETFARWITGESQPTVADLMLALEEMER